MGHYYDNEGNPQYELVGKNGKKRDVNIRDAKQLGYHPSVTTMTALLAKPGLDRWKADQLLNACIDYAAPRRIIDQYEYPEWEQDIKQWKAKVIEKSERITRESAKKGTVIHDALERYILTGEVDKSRKSILLNKCSGFEDVPDIIEPSMEDFVLPVMEKLAQKFNIPLDNWVPEKSFGHSLGFGGKVDLYSEDIILDFKTKSATADFEKDLGYPEHCMQLAAYRIGLGMPKAKCYNLFISTETPGLLQLKEWTEEEVQKSEEMFKLLLRFYQLSTGHDTSIK